MKNTLLFILATIAFFPLKAQIFAVDPMNLEAEVGQNQTIEVYTVVFNMGPDTLEVLFPAFLSRGTGGPDDWGYYWIDSDEEGGPAFEWIEISENGTEIEGLGDDMIAGPFPVGFAFPFYGQEKEHFWVNTNGVIGFDDQLISFANYPIPTNSEQTDFIAWFWDDLMLDTSLTHVYYKNFENKVVIQFEKFVHYPGTEQWITAEVILQRGGDIRIMYKQVREGFDTENATVGIQSASPGIGLQVVCNAPYIHSEQALRFDSPAGFISSVVPSDFLLPPGTQEHVWITYDAEGFEAGTYHQDLKCVTNDTNIAPVIISNTMHVVNAYTAGFHGYVTDAVTGFAINDCKVKVGEHHVFSNGNGWYELPLEPGVYSVTFVKNGYQTLVVEDTAAVEGFSPLSVELSSFYFIAGRVWADDNYVPDAFSYLYKLNEEGNVLDIFADLTGDLGWFEYPELSTAYYIVKAEPNPNSSYYGNYLPTYFGDVLYWEDATLVHLTGSTDDAHIHLVGTTNMPSGGGTISGTVTAGTDQASIENVPVLLQLHGSGDAVMAYSDSEGSFEFSDLGYGNYDLFADVFGKTIVPLNITLDESTPAITGIAMVMLSDEIVFLGIGESEFIAGLSKPYPNPAGDQVFLLLDLKKPARLNVEVMDIAGRVIIRDIKSVDGSGVISLDVARIPAGIYTLRIKDEGNGAMTCPFIKE